MSPPTYFTWQELSPYRSSARAARPLVLQFADDHHAFHEDAKRGSDGSMRHPLLQLLEEVLDDHQLAGLRLIEIPDHDETLIV